VPDGSAVAEGPEDEGTGILKGPVEMTAEDLADEEWGPVKEKKKDKKGKGKRSKQPEEDEDKDGRFFRSFSQECSDASAQRRTSLRLLQRSLLHHRRTMMTTMLKNQDQKFSPRRRRRS